MRAAMFESSSESTNRTRKTKTFLAGLSLAGLAATAMVFPAQTALAAPQDAPKSERFSLKVTSGKGKVGEAVTMTVDAQAKTVWHFNKDFPTSLKLTAPEGVTLSKDKLKIADASAFGEKAFSFPVKATASKAGKHKIQGTLKFAVCIESTCSMMKEDVTFVLDAS